jgi:hypothetical protein
VDKSSQIAEEDLLQEGGRLPLGLARLLGDPPGLLLGDGTNAPDLLSHDRHKLYTSGVSILRSPAAFLISLAPAGLSLLPGDEPAANRMNTP